MTTKTIASLGAFLHFEQLLTNKFRLCFYNPVIPDDLELSEKDTFNGFLVPNEYPEIKLYDFVKLLTKKDFQDGSIIILRYEKLIHEQFLLKDTKALDKVYISTEPVLIDPDYKDNMFCAQFCIIGATREFFNTSTKICYTLEIQEPLYPSTIVRKNPYTTPMLRCMKPESIEEFYNNIFYNQIMVVDFVLVRSSPDAAGYDLDFGCILDHTRDFDSVAEYKEAQKKRFTVKAKYLYDIILPYFYVFGFEMNGRSGDFMLRSSISRRGITLTYTVIEDNLDPTIGASVQLTIHNHNNFDVTFTCEEFDKSNEKMFSFRFLQFVPSMEFQHYLNNCETPDARAQMLGVSLVQNEKPRKNKV
jgi:hypothetical protein